MIRLYQWQIERVEGNQCVAEGYVSGHPRLSDGTHIHTSVLVQVTVDTEGYSLLLVTHSGNHYCLAGGDICTEKWERTDKNLNLFGVSSFGKCAVADAVRKKEKMGKELEKRLSENELFLMMLGERCTEAFFQGFRGYYP